MSVNVRAFTIVELLIVIVVIAILAAISVVAYNGIQNRANDTAILNDMAAFKKKMELYKIDNNGLYPDGATSGNGSLGPLGFTATKSAYATSLTTGNNLWYCRNVTQAIYGLVALSKSGKIFYVSQNAGPAEYTGAEAWSSTDHNCHRIINMGLGWQYQGYAASDTTLGPWRAWTGGN